MSVSSCWVLVTEFERARHISCTSPQLSPSVCYHRDRNLKTSYNPFEKRNVYFWLRLGLSGVEFNEEFLPAYYVVWNLGQNMEQLYGVRGSAILKKEKPTFIIIELDPTNQLWPGYNLATLEVTYLRVLWPDSLWSVVE